MPEGTLSINQLLLRLMDAHEAQGARIGEALTHLEVRLGRLEVGLEQMGASESRAALRAERAVVEIEEAMRKIETRTTAIEAALKRLEGLTGDPQMNKMIRVSVASTLIAFATAVVALGAALHWFHP